jgi:hypothetical protein
VCVCVCVCVVLGKLLESSARIYPILCLSHRIDAML